MAVRYTRGKNFCLLLYNIKQYKDLHMQTRLYIFVILFESITENTGIK